MTFAMILMGCSIDETCGVVTSYGSNWNGGYLIIEGDLLYVSDLLFTKAEIGDYMCVYE